MRERTLILAAHGAGDGSVANERILAVAKEACAARPGLEVVSAFHLGSPSFEQALRGIASDRATVVPLMTSNGYYVREHLPRQLRHDGTEPARVITPPVGSLDRVRSALALRVRDLARSSRGSVGVIVVGHGTRRNATSAAATRELASLVARTVPAAEVASAYLDEPPLLENVAHEMAADTVIIVPFLMGGGHHAGEDLERRTADLRRGARVLVTPAVGEICTLAAAALDLFDWHAPDRVYRLGTRRSRLALRQAEIAAQALAAVGVRTHTIALSSAGDEDRRRPIDQFETEGPFTDQLEHALVAGRIDLAVHSLKDLPLDHGGSGAVIAGILARGPAGEALVSRNGAGLADLPAGAVVATSSARRAAQLFAIRPDLRTEPLRGHVDERIAQVRSGTFHAAILAEAGLARLNALDALSERLPLDLFVPEAGQGALAITARVDDQPALAAARSVNHEPTRLAGTAERGAARLIEAHPSWLAAAWAEASDAVRLHARAINPSSGECRDAFVEAADAQEAGRLAAAQLFAREEVIA